MKKYQTFPDKTKRKLKIVSFLKSLIINTREISTFPPTFFLPPWLSLTSYKLSWLIQISRKRGSSGYVWKQRVMKTPTSLSFIVGLVTHQYILPPSTMHASVNAWTDISSWNSRKQYPMMHIHTTQQLCRHIQEIPHTVWLVSQLGLNGTFSIIIP